MSSFMGCKLPGGVNASIEVNGHRISIACENTKMVGNFEFVTRSDIRVYFGEVDVTNSIFGDAGVVPATLENFLTAVNAVQN